MLKLRNASGLYKIYMLILNSMPAIGFKKVGTAATKDMSRLIRLIGNRSATWLSIKRAFQRGGASQQ